MARKKPIDEERVFADKRFRVRIIRDEHWFSLRVDPIGHRDLGISSPVIADLWEEAMT